MGYTSIATFLHDRPHQRDALECAISAARQWGAHLHVVCAGVDDTDPGFYYAGAQAIAVQRNLEDAQESAALLKEKVSARLTGEDIAWDVEAITTMADGLASFLGDQMRFFDLVVLPKPYGPARSRIDEVALEACLFGAEVPILVVPENANTMSAPDHVMIAWNDCTEALAAAKSAVPLMKKAGETEICVIDPPIAGSERSDPGGRLAQMLARKGVVVDISVNARLKRDIAEQLLRRATEAGADLIVMGAYGHSRLREAMIGGVTRSMLTNADLPVLMAR